MAKRNAERVAKEALQGLVKEQQMRSTAEAMLKESYAKCKQYSFLVDILSEGMTSRGLVDLCIAAGFGSSPTPGDYTICNRAASHSNANSSDISSVRSEVEVDGCIGIPMTRLRRELVPSCFEVCSWPLNTTKLEKLVRAKFFGGDQMRCSLFLQQQGEILNRIRGAFIGLRAENIPFYELRHVQPMMTIFIEGMCDELGILDSVVSVAISQDMLAATFEDVSFYSQTDLDILISNVRRAYIEAKRPFDQIFRPMES